MPIFDRSTSLHPVPAPDKTSLRFLLYRVTRSVPPRSRLFLQLIFSQLVFSRHHRMRRYTIGVQSTTTDPDDPHEPWEVPIATRHKGWVKLGKEKTCAAIIQDGACVIMVRHQASHYADLLAVTNRICPVCRKTFKSAHNMDCPLCHVALC